MDQECRKVSESLLISEPVHIWNQHAHCVIRFNVISMACSVLLRLLVPEDVRLTRWPLTVAQGTWASPPHLLWVLRSQMCPQSCGSDVEQHRAFFSSLCCLCSGAEARRASRIPRYDVCCTHQDDVGSWGSGIHGSKQSSWPPETIPGNKGPFPPVTCTVFTANLFSWWKEVFRMRFNDLLNSWWIKTSNCPSKQQDFLVSVMIIYCVVFLMALYFHPSVSITQKGVREIMRDLEFRQSYPSHKWNKAQYWLQKFSN